MKCRDSEWSQNHSAPQRERNRIDHEHTLPAYELFADVRGIAGVDSDFLLLSRADPRCADELTDVLPAGHHGLLPTGRNDPAR